MPQSSKYDLEERLIDFAVLIIGIVNQLPANRVGNHLGGQLLRSGTSPALNYGEALSAESRADFVHKLKVVLKELRETFVCLKILVRISYLSIDNPALKECNELISIFVKSIATTRKNMNS
jgi:four helix bundle protein